MRLHKSLLLTLAVAAAAVLVAAAFAFGTHRARSDLLDQGQRQLQLMAPDLQFVLERFETLPFVLGQQPDLTAALAHPDDPAIIARLNRTLQTIQRQARVGALYLMDTRGLTLGASNWDQPLGFVGQNFSYRPYFREAIRGRAGRFYGIGTSTGEPGYFIAQPVFRDGSAGGPITGVIAVKISLAEFEAHWRNSEEAILLADRHGVVFLSNRPEWKYRSLGKLDDATRTTLAQTQQYRGKDVTPLDGPVGAHVTLPVGRLGWQLMLFPNEARVLRAGAAWAVGAALLLACAAVSAWALHQRRRRFEERVASRAALRQAELELEHRIAERTEQLSETNRHLEQKYAKLQETSQLLRTTQNELVQAGKLAMLGQMAAGVTHELNQPLAAIRAFADNARTFLQRGQVEQAANNLTHIGDASARMGAIIAQLKGFARKGETVDSVDLERSVRASSFLLESEFRRRDAVLDIEAAAPLVVTGDAVRIEQVLINLLRNALDAVEGAPVRRVSVRLLREGDDAVVRIADTGAGIPADVAPHLFEPFFTTKPSGQGLGLGLAISSSIVQAMNGRLTAHNRPEGGAQFDVRLPLPGTAQHLGDTI
ncbi:two-component system C4-dicarboxylate transport sensor histidine kinase DctB [Pseudoduganella flava]|uniref:C4-dicarboxylate transport sensor protein DctB n=1 Tax=Pseudoduganella flava TaxID=871742 RepID=A0A562PVA2_9BURK|nr:ATP-binding protein [Pseudoduganella flava]QGZ39426.1 sensor histidine kinase [Pseudoduganella flava]TWI48303.1 two-component system C4-dicarboxylate transport sensor histidine kinase DctB [Pseudoduganella flava]